MPSKVLLDCDPGVDDAIAILTAAHFCDLVGVTTVNGNVGIDHTTHNALLVAQIANLDVDVHSGASRPLVAAPSNTARIHGPTGLGDVPLPKLNRQAKSDDAVAYICDTARSVDGLHLLAVGPLTNIALALRSDPDLRSSLDGITIMGGSARSGNVTPTAEVQHLGRPRSRCNRVQRSRSHHNGRTQHHYSSAVRHGRGKPNQIGGYSSLNIRS